MRIAAGGGPFGQPSPAQPCSALPCMSLLLHLGNFFFHKWLMSYPQAPLLGWTALPRLNIAGQQMHYYNKKERIAAATALPNCDTNSAVQMPAKASSLRSYLLLVKRVVTWPERVPLHWPPKP